MTDERQRRIFARNLTRLLADKEHTQLDLARHLGLSAPTINSWCTGKGLPRMGKVQRIADYLGVSTTDLIDDGSFDTRGTLLPIRVPILGRIPAGIPLEAITEIEGTEEISWRHGEFFALRVKGDSMSPKIESGDVVIFRRQSTCDSGQICAVRVGMDDATLKRVRILDGGTIVLQPINAEYEPMIFTPQQIQSLPISILGVAIEIRRAL